MNDTININPNDLSSMIELMDKYHTTKYMLLGTNELGEHTRTSIFKDKIVVVTYQKNGWVRENVYWRDGTYEEVYHEI
jgi:hypothetical protein